MLPFEPDSLLRSNAENDERATRSHCQWEAKLRPVRMTNLEGQLRVDLTPSARP